MKKNAETNEQLLKKLEELKRENAELKAALQKVCTAETGILNQENFLSNILDNAPALIFLKDQDFRLVLVNRMFCELAGKPKEALIGRRDNEIFPAKDMDVVHENDLKVFSTGKTGKFEETMEFPDGPHTFMAIKSKIEVGNGSSKPMLLGIATDITSWMDAKKELQEAQEQFYTAFDANPNMMAICTFKEGRFIEANNCFTEKTGFKRKEVLGSTFDELNIMKSWKLKKLIRKLRVNNRLDNTEIVLYGKDGKEIPLLISAVPIFIKGNTYLLIIGTDISERKEMEEALRDALARSESLIKNSSLVAIQSFDRTGTIRLWNPICEKLYGYSAKEAIGRKVQDLLLSSSQKEIFESVVEKIWETGKPAKPGEWTVLNRDGKRLTVFSNMFPAIEHGKVKEIFCMDVDVTDQKRIQQEKRNIELKLMTHGKMAALGEVAASVAHEISQPLAFIKAVVQHNIAGLKSQSLCHNTLMGDLRKTDDCVKRISYIIKHLNSYGHKENANAETCLVQKALKNALVLMNNKLMRRRINLYNNVPEELPPVNSPPIELEQIFINLIQNSFDAFEGITGGSIHVDAIAKDDLIKIDFADSGKGIPRNILERIYDPFFTTKPMGKGSGLGLAIIKRIIEEHGGSFKCEFSEVGQGTLFSFTIQKSVLCRLTQEDARTES